MFLFKRPKSTHNNQSILLDPHNVTWAIWLILTLTQTIPVHKHTHTHTHTHTHARARIYWILTGSWWTVWTRRLVSYRAKMCARCAGTNTRSRTCTRIPGAGTSLHTYFRECPSFLPTIPCSIFSKWRGKTKGERDRRKKRLC